MSKPMYNHNTMTSHDSRRQRQHEGRRRPALATKSAMLCALAASLAAGGTSNNNAVLSVQAFGVAPTSPTTASKSRSALEISTTIPHHLPLPPQAQPSSSSLLDRLVDELHEATKPKPIKIKPTTNKTKKKKRKSASSTLPHDNHEAATAPSSAQSTYLPLELDEQEVRKRKLEWAGRYTSVEALRETFGANENKLWGDLQASTARRLYKTLLPRALLELSQLGVGQLQPQDLAPLAYQARVAAKLYARERCTVPARIGATLFDGFRQWLKYGKFQAHGMTYDQIWQKYADKICSKTEEESSSSSSSSTSSAPEVDVCLKILERSCVSNEGVDSLVLKDKADLSKQEDDQQTMLLERIHSQLEQDMYELLLPPSRSRQKAMMSNDGNTSTTTTKKQQKTKGRQQHPWSKRNHVLMVRLLARQKRLMQHREKQQQQQGENDRDVLRP